MQPAVAVDNAATLARTTERTVLSAIRGVLSPAVRVFLTTLSRGRRAKILISSGVLNVGGKLPLPNVSAAGAELASPCAETRYAALVRLAACASAADMAMDYAQEVWDDTWEIDIEAKNEKDAYDDGDYPDLENELDGDDDDDDGCDADRDDFVASPRLGKRGGKISDDDDDDDDEDDDDDGDDDAGDAESSANLTRVRLLASTTVKRMRAPLVMYYQKPHAVAATLIPLLYSPDHVTAALAAVTLYALISTAPDRRATALATALANPLAEALLAVPVSNAMAVQYVAHALAECGNSNVDLKPLVTLVAQGGPVQIELPWAKAKAKNGKAKGKGKGKGKGKAKGKGGKGKGGKGKGGKGKGKAAKIKGDKKGKDQGKATGTKNNASSTSATVELAASDDGDDDDDAEHQGDSSDAGDDDGDKDGDENAEEDDDGDDDDDTSEAKATSPSTAAPASTRAAAAAAVPADPDMVPMLPSAFDSCFEQRLLRRFTLLLRTAAQAAAQAAAQCQSQNSSSDQPLGRGRGGGRRGDHGSRTSNSENGGNGGGSESACRARDAFVPAAVAVMWLLTMLTCNVDMDRLEWLQTKGLITPHYCALRRAATFLAVAPLPGLVMRCLIGDNAALSAEIDAANGKSKHSSKHAAVATTESSSSSANYSLEGSVGVDLNYGVAEASSRPCAPSFGPLWRVKKVLTMSADAVQLVSYLFASLGHALPHEPVVAPGKGLNGGDHRNAAAWAAQPGMATGWSAAVAATTQAIKTALPPGLAAATTALQRAAVGALEAHEAAFKAWGEGDEMALTDKLAAFENTDCAGVTLAADVIVAGVTASLPLMPLLTPGNYMACVAYKWDDLLSTLILNDKDAEDADPDSEGVIDFGVNDSEDDGVQGDVPPLPVLVASARRGVVAVLLALAQPRMVPMGSRMVCKALLLLQSYCHYSQLAVLVFGEPTEAHFAKKSNNKGGKAGKGGVGLRGGAPSRFSDDGDDFGDDCYGGDGEGFFDNGHVEIDAAEMIHSHGFADREVCVFTPPASAAAAAARACWGAAPQLVQLLYDLTSDAGVTLTLDLLRCAACHDTHGFAVPGRELSPAVLCAGALAAVVAIAPGLREDGLARESAGELVAWLGALVMRWRSEIEFRDHKDYATKQRRAWLKKEIVDPLQTIFEAGKEDGGNLRDIAALAEEKFDSRECNWSELQLILGPMFQVNEGEHMSATSVYKGSDSD